LPPVAHDARSGLSDRDQSPMKLSN
jgi:hypothetical protein